MSLCLCGLLALGAAGAVAAKKPGKKRPNSFAKTLAVNAAVPDVPAAGPTTPLNSTITVPKSFKGRVIADVDVTGIATTGSAAGAADDLTISLTAPNGRTVQLLSGIGDTSIGPLTLDDDSRTSLCDDATPTCEDPGAIVVQPFAGTANLFDPSTAGGSGGSGPLSSFNGVRANGAWTLQVYDENGIGDTSTFNSWGLRLRAAKPVVKTTGPGTFSANVPASLVVLDDVAGGPSVPVTSTLTVPKKFKGKVIGDLDLTGLTTTGSAAGAADDLRWRLTAPNGRSVTFNDNSFGDVSIGPLTFDDESRTALCDGANTNNCEDPYASLVYPFAGTANTQAIGTGGSGPLSSFDGLGMAGTWTFTMWDEATIGTISTLNAWGVRITAAKPVRTS